MADEESNSTRKVLHHTAGVPRGKWTKSALGCRRKEKGRGENLTCQRSFLFSPHRISLWVTGCPLTGLYLHRRWAGELDKGKEAIVAKRPILINKEETGNRSKQAGRSLCIARVMSKQGSYRTRGHLQGTEREYSSGEERFSSVRPIWDWGANSPSRDCDPSKPPSPLQWNDNKNKTHIIGLLLIVR